MMQKEEKQWRWVPWG